MTPDGRTEHGDVIMTEDGALFVAYRAHRLHSLTGIMVTDGDLSLESPVDLCVDYRTLTDDEVRVHQDRIQAILGTEHDSLRFNRDHCEATGADEERSAYESDIASLDDAARIILTK